MKWIRAKEVASKLGVSLSQVGILMRSDPNFPRAINLSPKVVVYSEDEVDAWMLAVQTAKREPVSV